MSQARAFYNRQKPPGAIGPEISTITGQPIPTFEEQMQKRKELGGALSDLLKRAGHVVTTTAPGSGEYLSLQDTLKSGREAESALSRGKYTEALGKYIEGFTNSLGLLGIAGTATRLPRFLRELDEMPRITAAAIKMKNGKVLTGKAHYDVFEKIPVAKQSEIADADGFVTNTGKFLTREEAVALLPEGSAGKKTWDASDIVGKEIEKKGAK